MNGTGEATEVVDDEDKETRRDHQGIEESMPAKSMAPNLIDDPKALDSSALLNGKYGDSQESLNQKTPNGDHFVDNGGSNMNKMDVFTKQQVEAREELDGKGDQRFREVSRIKEVLDDCNNLSDRMLLELLMNLQKMDMCVEILQDTMIGKSVQALRKHGAREIRKIARSLICAWRGKVDQWVQLKETVAEAPSAALDEFPSCPFNEEAPAAPSASTELLQIFEGVDQTEFFSILPRDGSWLFPEELIIGDEEQVPIKENPVGDDVTEKVRVDNLTRESRTLKFLGSQDIQESNRAPVHQNALVNNKGKGVSGKDLAENQKFRQVNMKANTFFRGKESDKAFMKRRIPLQPKMHSTAKHKQYAGNEGMMKDQSSAMKLRAPSLQYGPVIPPQVKNNAQFAPNLERSNTSRHTLLRQQDRTKVSERSVLQKVEETRRKLREGYQNVEAAKKRRAIQVIDANSLCTNQQPKRYRLHNARRN